MRQPKAASVPPGWTRTKFGDCAELINGRAYSQHELLDAGTPVLRIQNLNGGDRWYYSDLSLPDEKYCVEGDLLFAWSASFGPYIWTGPRSIYHYHIWRVIPGDRLDKRFAYHLLAYITRELKSTARGIAMLHLTKSGMEEWEIAVPPLDEQRRIARVLDAAEALREKRRASLDKFDQLVQAFFEEMFGDPTAPAETGSSRALSEVAELINGDRSANYPSGSDLVEDGILFLSTKNINNGQIDLTETQHITPAKFASLSRGKLKRHDLVITLRGTLGQVCEFDCAFETAFINAQMMIIRASHLVLPEFLCSVLMHRRMQRKLKSLGSGSAIPQLTAKQVGELSIPVPELGMQKRFVETARLCRVKAKVVREQQALMEVLYSSLQHRAFRGEV